MPVNESQTTIRPMQPVLHKEIFDSPDYFYQIKWDGVRMVSYINSSQVTLINRRLNKRTEQYPELQKLAKLIDGYNVILDGEIIALKSGKPSFPSVIRRDRCQTNKTIFYLQNKIPVSYMVFDILRHNDRDLCNIPLEDRKHLLKKILTPVPDIHLVEDFDKGSTLFTAVKVQNMEGVVAKKRQSRYIEGKKHREWLKIKYRREIFCVIGGYTMHNQKVNSLLLGIYQDNRLLYAGKAGSGLKTSELEILTVQLPELHREQSPFINLKNSAHTYFIEPLLTVKVEFAEWTENMHLRSPVIKHFVNVNPEQCRV